MWTFLWRLYHHRYDCLLLVGRALKFKSICCQEIWQIADLALFRQPQGAHWRCASPSPVFDRKIHAQWQSDICSPSDNSLVFSTDTPLSPSEHPMPFFINLFPLLYPTLSHSYAAFFFLPPFLEPAYFHTRTTTELNSGFIKYAGKEKEEKKKATRKAPTS